MTFGATPVFFDSLASGAYHFNVGLIGAGATLALQLSVGSGASVDAGSIYTCTSIEPGPDDCAFHPGSASAFSSGTLAITNLTPVPEPSLGVFLVGGLAVLGTLLRVRRNRPAAAV